jgi:hypothetical protein
MIAVDDESLEKALAKVVGDGDMVYAKCLEIRDDWYCRVSIVKLDR